ncbi:hypothetical protein ACFX2I_020195 [Malus domestica]
MDVTFSESEYFYASIPSPSDHQGENTNGDLGWLEIPDNVICSSGGACVENENCEGSQQDNAENENSGCSRQQPVENWTNVQFPGTETVDASRQQSAEYDAEYRQEPAEPAATKPIPPLFRAQ